MSGLTRWHRAEIALRDFLHRDHDKFMLIAKKIIQVKFETDPEFKVQDRLECYMGESSMKPDPNQPPRQDEGNENGSLSNSNLDFQSLLERVKNGDGNAMHQLVESCRDYLLLIANQEFDRDLHAKLGPSDIVQNTLLAVHQHVDDFRGSEKGQFLAWIRQILLRDLNRTRRELKGTAKRDTRRERSIQGDSRVGRLPINLNDRNLTPQTNAVRNEEQQLLNIAMNRLQDDYRKVIVFRNSQQLTFQEIGERMNRSDDAAQKLWTRAIEQLKKELIALNAI